MPIRGCILCLKSEARVDELLTPPLPSRPERRQLLFKPIFKDGARICDTGGRPVFLLLTQITQEIPVLPTMVVHCRRYARLWLSLLPHTLLASLVTVKDHEARDSKERQYGAREE